MTNLFKLGRISFISIALTIALLSPNLALASNCPEIPSVKWWGNATADNLSAYVDKRHGGDWDAYIGKWERYEEKMRNTMFSGKSAHIKSQNLDLKDEALADYIKLITRRIEAMHCIAGEVAEARLIEEISNMETAAGGSPEQHLTPQTSQGCPKFAKVEWWDTSHDKIISYVSRKHSGDWKAYLGKWDRQLKDMKSLQERGGVAVIKSKNLKLQGENLQKYVEALEGRISVTSCLAERELKKATQKKTGEMKDG